MSKKKRKKRKDRKNSLIAFWTNTNESSKWVLFLGIFLSIIAILQTCRTNNIAKKDLNQNWKIAKESGAFNKPELEIKFGNVALPENDWQIKIAYGSKAHPNRWVHLSSLPFIITNKGQKSLKDLTFSFMYESKNELAIPNELARLNEYSKPEFSRRTYLGKGNDIDKVDYLIPNLHPFLSLGCSENISLKPTARRVFYQEQDSSLSEYYDELFFEHDLTVYATAENIKTQDLNIGLTKYEVPNKDSLINSHIEINLNTLGSYDLNNTFSIVSFNEQISCCKDSVQIDLIQPDSMYIIVFDPSDESYKVLSVNGGLYKSIPKNEKLL